MRSSPVGLGHLENASFAIIHAWQFSLLLLRANDEGFEVASADVCEEAFEFGESAEAQVYMGCVVGRRW